MIPGKRLYRSNDAVMGGVCAGIAQYFDVDPLVARILAVTLAIASGGVLCIAYLALWVTIPASPTSATVVDVTPQSVTSDAYGQVDVPPCAQKGPSPTASASAMPGYVGSGHVPPKPPAGAACGASAYATSYAPPAAGQVPPSAQVSPSAPQPDQPSQTGARVGLVIGSLLLFFGVVSLVAGFAEGISTWDLWPLFFVIAGIATMVTPGREGRRMAHFVDGMMLFSLGVALLLMSLNMVSWRSVESVFTNLWPLLVMMAGFFVLGMGRKTPLLTLAAGLCFVAFCFAGLFLFGIPGFMDAITLNLPFGRSYSLTLPHI